MYGEIKKKQNKLEDGYLVDYWNRYAKLRVKIGRKKTFEPLLKKSFEKRMLIEIIKMSDEFLYIRKIKRAE